ncbi:MAG TPA: efflux RND transporter periplasmic adaptor subunit [Candidatus Kapabacteria bacterium]|nr:efflux RND transporter periplasmic adaptor subunit [Candidatus Kapabacteria bacterium]
MKIITTIFFPVIVLCCIGCHHANQDDAAKQEAFVLSDSMKASITTSIAAVQPVRTELKLYGKITADRNKLIEVYPVVGGSVEHVFVELGDHVEKGQVLATIRSNEAAGYEKDLQDAENDVLVASNALKVAEELYNGKLNTDREVLEAKSQLEKAQSQLTRVKKTFDIYGLKKGALYEVKAPISGFIIEKNINEDMQLRSDHTDNIFDIAQIEEVWALANVSESIIGDVKVGMHADVTTVSYPGKVYSGTVDKIFNVIDPQTKAMTVRVKLQNNEYLLKPEMRASIMLSSESSEQKVAVPSKALIFDKSRNFVMVFANNKVETRQIEVSSQAADTTYIESGLKEGETVITTNQLLIYNALND